VAFRSILVVWINLKFLFGFLVSTFIGVTYLLCVCPHIFRFHPIIFISDEKTGSSAWSSPISLSSTFSYCIAISISSSFTIYIYRSPYFWNPSIFNSLPCLVLYRGTPSHSGLPRPVCRAICRNGQQCRNSASLGSDVCRTHSFESSFSWYWKLLKMLPYSRWSYCLTLVKQPLYGRSLCQHLKYSSWADTYWTFSVNFLWLKKHVLVDRHTFFTCQ
jgi:hypothetical protein